MSSLSQTVTLKLQDAAGATGNGNVLPVSGYNTLTFQLTGTFSATVTFEASDNQSDWVSLQTVNVADNASSATATATGIYRASISGLGYIRARVSAFASGNVTVTATATVGGGSSGGGSTSVTGGTINSGTVVGNVAAGTADSGNPVKVGGKYNLSAPTLDDGDRGDVELDVNGNVKVREQYGAVAEDNNKGVIGVLQKPVSGSTYSPSDHTNFGAAAGTGVLIATVPANVYSVYVTSGTTALRYFQLFNQGSVPVVGQTPVASYPMGSVPAGGLYELKLDTAHFAPSKYFSTGLAAAISSTSGTLGTASITVTDHSWHIKYVT